MPLVPFHSTNSTLVLIDRSITQDLLILAAIGFALSLIMLLVLLFAFRKHRMRLPHQYQITIIGFCAASAGSFLLFAIFGTRGLVVHAFALIVWLVCKIKQE
jgi:hypothetical protein